jgi:hypothetical protein
MTFDRFYSIAGRGLIAIFRFESDETLPKIGEEIEIEDKLYEITGCEYSMTLLGRPSIKSPIGLLVRKK